MKKIEKKNVEIQIGESLVFRFSFNVNIPYYK